MYSIGQYISDTGIFSLPIIGIGITPQKSPTGQALVIKLCN